MIHILRGPVAARTARGVSSEEATQSTGAHRGNSKARAKAWGLKRITPGCIAACAVLVRYPLCLYHV